MKNQATFVCPDEQSMQSLGTNLVSALSCGSGAEHTLITLSGELGAGKSVLARAMIHGAGYAGRVKSPTYTLIETYQVLKPVGSITRVAHLDLYRLADPDELHYLGFDDVLENHDLVLIEWPEKAMALLPEANLHITIEYAQPSGRRVIITGDKVAALAQCRTDRIV